MNERRIIKVFPEPEGTEAWRTTVMLDDGTVWVLDTSAYHEWRQRASSGPIPSCEPSEPSLFERVFGKSHGGY